MNMIGTQSSLVDYITTLPILNVFVSQSLKCFLTKKNYIEVECNSLLYDVSTWSLHKKIIYFFATANQHQMKLNKSEEFPGSQEAELRSPEFSMTANTSSCLSLDWLMQTEVEAQFDVSLVS